MYILLHHTIKSNWNISCGRKSPYKPMDVLFMTLTVLKHGGTWDFAQPFRIKSPTFERLIIKFLPMISAKLHEKFVADIAKSYMLEELREKKEEFKILATLLKLFM